MMKSARIANSSRKPLLGYLHRSGCIYPDSLLRVVAVGLVVLLAGCGDSDDIRRYKAPKPAAMSASPEQTMPHAPLDSSSPQRMLGAIVPNAAQGWFFKVNGTPEALERHVSDFKGWLKTMRFEGGQPSWQLPDGWRQMPASGMRFATVLLGPGEDALELSVIPLPIEGDPTQSVLANVNRWRGQLGLGPIRQDQLADATESIAVDGLTATFVDFVNEGSSNVAGSRPAGPATPATSPPPGEAAATSLELEAPEGWTAAPLVTSRGGITLRHEAAFEITDGDQRLEFTLDRLPAAGSLLQNVNRWRGQIGLGAASAEELSQAVSQLDLGGATADMIELTGEQEKILGIVAVRGEQAWYFKLKGDKELAEREKENFLALARSVKFP
jgi:hypothetical protein